MTLDVYAQQLAQQAAEATAKRLLEQLPGIVRAELERQRQAEHLDSAAMAARFGKSPQAFRAWLRRPGGAHVEALARTSPGGGPRYWLRTEVEALDRGPR